LVRGLIGQMEGEEARLLAERSAPLQTKARLARLAAWSGALVAVTLAVIAGALVSRELAGRRRAEQTLGETQTRFRQVLASSTAVIYANTISGASFSPSWVSENVTRITGYGPDEPLRPTWWLDNLHPDDRARVLAEMPALIAGDQLTTEYRFRYKDGTYHWVHDESRLRREAALRTAAAEGRYEEENWRIRKDGSRIWADVVITAVRDDRGTLLGFAKVTRDLTERQRAEEALRASEERFRILAVTANDAII